VPVFYHLSPLTLQPLEKRKGEGKGRRGAFALMAFSTRPVREGKEKREGKGGPLATRKGHRHQAHHDATVKGGKKERKKREGSKPSATTLMLSIGKGKKKGNEHASDPQQCLLTARSRSEGRRKREGKKGGGDYFQSFLGGEESTLPRRRKTS